MACIVKSYDKRTGITYAYTSTAVWDPEKGYSKPVRKCIGKVDPETGEIVPNGKRGRPRKSPLPEVKATQESRDSTDEVAALQDALRRAEDKRREDEATIRLLKSQSENRSAQIRRTIDALKELETAAAHARIACENLLK